MNSNIAIKAYFVYNKLNEVRRFCISNTSTFEEFKTLLESLVSDKLQNPRILYLDNENDWIHVGSEHEFKEALRLNPANSLLRFKILSSYPQQSQEAQRRCHGNARPWKCSFAQKHCGTQDQEAKPCHDRRSRAQNWIQFVQQLYPQVSQVIENVFQKPEHQQADTAPHEQTTTSEAPTKPQEASEVLVVENQQLQPESSVISNNVDTNQAPIVAAPPQDAVPEAVVTVESSTTAPEQHEEPPATLVASLLPESETISVASEPAQVSAPAPIEVKSEPLAPTTSVPVELEQDASIKPQLDILQAMGFTNAKLNQHLLKQFKGNMQRTVDALVSIH